jgi:hypothetical protein
MQWRRDKLWDAGVIVLALLFAWLCTLPSAIALINWDNAAYIAETASGVYQWTHVPWSSHLGVGHEYKLGVWLMQALGGTVIDGFRLVNALVFAASCWVLFDAGRRLMQSPLGAAVLTLWWATVWVNLHYHLILEDNILFLAPAAAMLRLCVLRLNAWRARDSLLCGMFCLLGFLGSYQALPYMGAAIYAALLGPGRGLLRRVRDAVLVGGGFLGAMVTWMLLMVSTSKLTWKVVTHQVLMGPDPLYMPRSARAILAYILDGHSLFETLGNGVLWNLSFHAYKLPWHHPVVSRFVLGLVATLLMLALLGLATYWAWKTRQWAAHILVATMLMLTLSTSLHKDLEEYTGLKRYDCVPLIMTFLFAIVLAELRQRDRLRKLAVALVVVIGLVIPVQFAFGLRWSIKERARYVTASSWNRFPHPEPMQYGREGKSWFNYFRDLDRAHRKACTLVLSYGEIADSTWNFDITGSLYSEVHDHIVLIDDDMMARFRPTVRRVVPHLLSVRDAAKIPACAWISPAANELLARPR